MIKPNITFKGVTPSPALEENILLKASKIEERKLDVIKFNIAIEYSQNSQHKGKMYSVKIDLVIPKIEVVANHAVDEDPYKAVHQAFQAIIRQLDDYKNKQIDAKQSLIINEV